MFRPHTLVLLGLIALSAAACGRRGPLEPPPAAAPAGQPQIGANAAGANPSVTRPKTGAAAVNTLPAGVGLSAGASAPDPEDELPSAAVAAPTGIPAPTESSSRRRKGYVIPKGPFPLDPLL
ncbi:LPS translocon maturation chaperone LptM [Methylobacterium sp. SyP6R]|uniref:LPS translocon maturation chaperone LptM n=1 Tax=Methylobacterium sp. SyP6R TaxID=2718876 RepID=UPI001F2B79C4|nr:lipoprotein [Methylobacterium sp. SyP6R]MCF4128629.1 lipoprotein [Methylobacterium sp. SyP6R]